MAEDTSPLGGGDSLSAARAPSSYVKKGDRQMFTVELRPGETTIVSWKKLMKDANKVRNKGPASAPEHLPNANPSLESRIAPGQPKETEEQGAPQTNRFSAVIEKIERLYMGKDSSDEEDLLDVPDDQYDTEDSFIDDAELDEYFEVDNSAIKHDGFFVNRGKLERIVTQKWPWQCHGRFQWWTFYCPPQHGGGKSGFARLIVIALGMLEWRFGVAMAEIANCAVLVCVKEEEEALGYCILGQPNSVSV